MAIFDDLIANVASRFELGSKAEALVRDLLRLISEQSGGVAGFLEKFRSAGFGDQIASWLGRGAGPALPGSAVEQALGAGSVVAIASRLGLGTGVVGDAIGYLTPKLVGLLTPGGAIPTRLPASAASFLYGPEPKPAAVYVGHRPAGNTFEWLPPLVLILGVTLLAYFISLPPEPEEPVEDVTQETAPASAPVEASEASPIQIQAALSGLKPGFSGADLVGILNKFAINFATGSAEIPEASKAPLQQAAGLIKQLPASTHVKIDGFTDATGDPAANLALSQRRADAVRDLLIGSGVAPKALTARGHGSAEATQGSVRGERRIEFSVQ